VADALRFLLAGAINTGLTIAVFEAAMFVVSPSIAYVIAWVVGIAFLMVVYPDRVFPGGRKAASDRVLLAAIYCAVFLFGLAVLHVTAQVLSSPQLAIVPAAVATTTANFILTRALLRR
jgi:putative flippase GtrA